MSKTIIVPDVHGRTFWKRAIDLYEEGDEIIFLGDYIDPYDFDGVNANEALSNFKEILDFASNNADHVKLLLGNHDLSYLSSYMEKCRYDRKNASEIKRLFIDNLDLFRIGYVKEINGKSYTFTHSCMTSRYINFMSMDEDEYFDAKSLIIALNDMLVSDFDTCMKRLSYISRARGGYDNFGSCVWADVSEIEYDTINTTYYQVFGHTQQFSNEMYIEFQTSGKITKVAPPIITDNYACLDTKTVYVLENDFNDLKTQY